MRNLITDVRGLMVGQAHDAAAATGVTTAIFERPTIASVAVLGGAPGTRDTTLLEPGMAVEHVDAIVLSGGSAWGLGAADGVMRWLAKEGRGFPVGTLRVPIVPQAILFDLMNGGDKPWARGEGETPYARLGAEAATAASVEFALGTAGAGFGATTANLKGGLGSARSSRSMPSAAPRSAMARISGRRPTSATGSLVALAGLPRSRPATRPCASRAAPARTPRSPSSRPMPY